MARPRDRRDFRLMNARYELGEAAHALANNQPGNAREFATWGLKMLGACTPDQTERWTICQQLAVIAHSQD